GARPLERLGIDVEAEQTHARRRRFQQSRRMTTHAHCPVDHPSLAPRPQQEHDLVDEDRNVNRYTPSCANRSNSDGSPSPFDRSYSSNRGRSQTSKNGRPGPTSVTSLTSPASTSRNFAGMLRRPFGSTVCWYRPLNMTHPGEPFLGPWSTSSHFAPLQWRHYNCEKDLSRVKPTIF